MYKGCLPYSGKCNTVYDAFLDLLDDEVSVEFQRNKLNTLLNARSTISCAYCDGLTEKSVKYRAAEQL